MIGRHLDSHFNCDNLDVDMTMSLSEKTVSYPLTNSSTNASILRLGLRPGFLYALTEFFA